MKKTLTYLSVALLGTLSLTATAYAGCNPACKKGEQCRYEAAGGKYYCESLKGGSLKGVGKLAPGRAPGSAKTAPVKTVTK